ncbi:hypothetical protein LCGC14_0430900 [marine sediment metagenome]|uniref:Uncharacterized protein n=1 Tax=marine sediment metagenome TaxID=412755 RepID=A0A0F9SMZ3_9ZZZZ
MAGARVNGADLEKLVSYLDGNNFVIPGTSEANKGEFTILDINGEIGIDSEVTLSGGTVLKFKGGVLYEVEAP